MSKNSMTYQTDDFGFDFYSVFAKRFGTTAFTSERTEDLANSSNNAVPDDIAAPDDFMSIEEMAQDLRNALSNEEENDVGDGVSLSEIMRRNQKPHIIPGEAPVRRKEIQMHDLEDQLSIDRILDQVLQEAQLAVSRGIIWGATLDAKIWRPLQTDAQISSFLHSLGIRRYGHSVRWFANRITGDPTYRSPGFFESACLWGKISFADGLLDIQTNTFRERMLDDRVTAVLRYPYASIQSPPSYRRLEEAMRSIAGSDQTYLRLQELCGVALHAEPSGRILYFQHFNPRVASIFTKLLGKIWSESAVSFLGLRDYERSFRTAQVLEHPIAISGKEGENTLKDISTILALVDGDGVNTDRKNMDPFDFVGRCSLICAGRNLPSLQQGSMQTLRFYLVRVNLTGELPENISIRELLGYTREFIVWSIEGLRRYIANNGHFTSDADSDIPEEDASIIDFVNKALEDDPNGKLPASILHETYASFCAENNITQLPKERLVSYLRDTFHIKSRTIRVSWYNKGRPVFGYVGVCFNEDYLSLIAKMADEESPTDPWRQELEDSDEDDRQSFEDDDWKPDLQDMDTLNF